MEIYPIKRQNGSHCTSLFFSPFTGLLTSAKCDRVTSPDFEATFPRFRFRRKSLFETGNSLPGAKECFLPVLEPLYLSFVPYRIKEDMLQSDEGRIQGKKKSRNSMIHFSQSLNLDTNSDTVHTLFRANFVKVGCNSK